MKVKFWVYMENMGDGSAIARIFNSEEAAEKYAAHDYERFCEDIYFKEIEVDDAGKLISPNPIHCREQLGIKDE